MLTGSQKDPAAARPAGSPFKRGHAGEELVNPQPGDLAARTGAEDARQVIVDVAAAAPEDAWQRLRRRRHARCLARRTDLAERLLDGLRDRRRLRIAGMPHRLREVGRADEEHVDVVDLQDLVDVLHGILMLDLYADERLRIRLHGEIRHARTEPPAVGARAGSKTAAGTGPEFGRGDRALRIRARVDVRNLHALHAAIEDGLDVGRIVAARASDGGDPGGISRHRHHLDIGGADGAVLAVDQHPVEARIGQHLDELRARKHERDAECDLAAVDLGFHGVLHSRGSRMVTS
jgi:hypothetical protein